MKSGKNMTILSESITALVKSFNQTMDLFQEDPVNSFFPFYLVFKTEKSILEKWNHLWSPPGS